MGLLEDFLIREIFLTHDPDDHLLRLDSEMLLDLVEDTFDYATDNVFRPHLDAIGCSNIDLTESSQEPISRIIYMISNEIHHQCFEDENLHRKTLVLLEILGHYSWDAKVVLALASFVHIFASFSLIMQLQPVSALAVSLAVIRRLPTSITTLKPKFKAMKLLVKTMLKVTKIIVVFEGISLQHELANDRAMDIAKSRIFLATYWIFRSILVCSSHTADLRNSSLEQVFSDRTVIAAWGLHSLGNKLNSLGDELEQCVQNCKEQIETRLYQKLLHMFKEKQPDNQKALTALFASQSNFPFKNSHSRDKIGIVKLKSKMVLLLITNPDFLHIDKALFLVQQVKTTEESYVVIWVPIRSTNEWSYSDKTSFEFFSNRLPWLSVRRPWLLNSSVVRYIGQEWSFKHDPVMVVLDENGVITNKNAMNMVWIWGNKAFPFSDCREKELWEEAKWSIDFMINGISPLLSEWVEQGKNICIYGSDNLDWIKEFNGAIKTLAAGIHLEVVYVGCKNPRGNVRAIINTIDQENLSNSLTFNNVLLFWFRFEVMKRSIDEHNHTSNDDGIAARVAELLEFNGGDGWVVIGRGSSTDVMILDQEKIRECIACFSLWGRNVHGMGGLVGAIRAAIEPSVGGDEVVPYEDGMVEKRLICGTCRRPMEKFVLYKCDG